MGVNIRTLFSFYPEVKRYMQCISFTFDLQVLFSLFHREKGFQCIFITSRFPCLQLMLLRTDTLLTLAYLFLWQCDMARSDMPNGLCHVISFGIHCVCVSSLNPMYIHFMMCGPLALLCNLKLVLELQRVLFYCCLGAQIAHVNAILMGCSTRTIQSNNTEI